MSPSPAWPSYADGQDAAAPAQALPHCRCWSRVRLAHQAPPAAGPVSLAVLALWRSPDRQLTRGLRCGSPPPLLAHRPAHQ